MTVFGYRALKEVIKVTLGREGEGTSQIGLVFLRGRDSRAAVLKGKAT